MTVRFIPTYVGYTDGHRTRLVPATVHPHIRGVYFRSCAGFYSRRGSSPHTWGIRAGARPPVSVFGSSPHTWGIRRLRSNHRIGRRFIPTYVGYTHANNPAISRCTVHPHIRGAYSVYPSFLPSVFGSSPPTWGIRLHCFSAVPNDRFIPTYVGHTVSPNATMRPASVHPHLRGAYGRRPVGAERRPVHPHLRGAYGPRGAAAATGRRFIPTYVGHTDGLGELSPGPAGSSPPTWGIRQKLNNGDPSQAVHPHLRGAYVFTVFLRFQTIGSSPPTWGIPSAQMPQCVLPRFIPTYVGHTVGGRSAQSAARFIPTYVGHTARAVRRRPQAAGSSPPTWGIRTGWGNYPPAQRVHPHLRGAYAAGRGRFPAPPGSSPHTWGIPYIRPFGCSHPRFIPTYVGHTPEGKSHSLRDLGSSPHT